LRVAVVTGGASGMGRSICEQLARRGDAVAVLDLDVEQAEQVAKEVNAAGGRAMAAAVDVADRATVDAAIERVRVDLGPIDILVTSAGQNESQPFQEITLESWNRIIAINLTGTFNCVQAVIGDMVTNRWGRIVTISSSSAQRGSVKMAHYVASKGGVIALTKALAREYAPFGITVNDIPPSSIDTPMARRAQQQGTLPDDEAIKAMIPVGHLGGPEDVAAACLFLCSEEAGFITGQVLGVNGGSVV
jgi:2-hydroxycyclohexanecarboxyl-CoA dehydrogenase